MTTIGNLFALLVLVITAIMFFSNRYHLTRSRGYFLATLILTFASIVVDIVKAETFEHLKMPPFFSKIIASVDYSIILLASTFLAVYLIAKICEHSKGESNFFYARLALTIIFSLLCLALILNIPFGFIFTATKTDAYVPGPAYVLPYATLIPQTLVVIAYAFKYHKTTSQSVNHALGEGVLAVALCLVIKFLYRDVTISIISMVLIELIFFLNFQNHKLGVNSLTNLSGERAFMKEINSRIEKKEPFKVFLIHINNLTSIKRAYGHKVGNEMLWHFARRLERKFIGARAFNLYAAIFALVFPQSNTDGTETESVLAFMEHGVDVNDAPIKLSYTVSEIKWSDEADADLVYEKLEYAIEAARTLNLKYQKCSPELEASRVRRKRIIERIKTIGTSAGYEVWYQPIYSVRKSGFSSMEALIRLKESDGSFISPAEFIPIAENTGQIVPITWFVIEESCRALATKSELAGMRVSINLPMLQLSDPYFEEKLNEIVDRYNISHDQVSFEFTERNIMDDLTMVEKNMRRLARSGYTFYLDDFGTGYSNFECVLKLPLKTIKLDMSLTSTVEALKSNYGLVKVLTALFHKMGMNVVAEGAETEEQIEILKSYNVDGIQGYYYTKPLPLAGVAEFLEKSRNK